MKRNRSGRYWMMVWFVLLWILPGCWDLEEVDRRAFATTLGVDAGPGRQIILTVQIPIPQKMLPPGAGGDISQGKNFSTATMAGSSVANAFHQLQTKTFRSLVVQQNKSVIISEEAARAGVAPLTDWLTRNPKAPPQALVFITNGKTAKDILAFASAQMALPGLEFISAGQSTVKYDRTYFIPVWQFEQKLLYEARDAYAPLIDVAPKEGNYRITGLAVFNGYHMAGKLDTKEAQCFGILDGLMSTGGMSFETPEGQIISLRNVEGRTRIKVAASRGQLPVFEVQSRVAATLNELSGKETNLDPPQIRSLERLIARSLKRRLSAVIRKLQGYNADCIDFGEQFRFQHPGLWEKTRWKELYPVVPFRITVTVSVRQDGVFR